MFSASEQRPKVTRQQQSQTIHSAPRGFFVFPKIHRRSRRDAMPRLPQRSKRLLRLPRIQNPSPTGAAADAMPRLPPSLPSELVEEILLRVPPEEPKSLFRSTLVCKLWLRILTGAAFRKSYRERHHGTPPMLGLFRNYRKTSYHTQFVPTLADLSPPRLGSSPFLRALDARHGRVLFKMDPDPAVDCPREPAPHEHFLVWDPITHEGWLIPMPGRSIGGWFAVFCAKDGCDHLDCHGHPFRVAHAFVDEFDYTSFSAYLYSSENGTWSDTSSVEYDGEEKDLNHFRNLYEITTNVLVGNALYFNCDLSPVIMRYGLADRELSLIEKPDVCRYMSGQVTVENGILGFAAIVGFSIYIWSREVDEHGAAAWVQPRVIKLETLLPPRYLSPKLTMCGFAEEIGVIFLCTKPGIFTIELKSGRARNLRKDGYTRDPLIPYVSLYTPGRGIMPLDPPHLKNIDLLRHLRRSFSVRHPRLGCNAFPTKALLHGQ